MTSNSKFHLNDAPDDVMMELAIFLGYLIKKMGPQEFPPIADIQLTLQGWGIQKVPSTNGTMLIMVEDNARTH